LRRTKTNLLKEEIMKILKTTSVFFGMLLLVLAAMFYAQIATEMPMQAEYHAMQAEYHAMQADNGVLAIAMTAPFLVIAGMVAVGYKKIINKYKFTRVAAGGGDGDEEEITAFGGGAGFRKIA
jgi:hypothetical protein